LNVSVIDESRNIFRIEGPYDLNCNETRIFGYIDKFTIWRADKCCRKHSNWPDSQKERNHSVELKKYSRWLVQKLVQRFSYLYSQRICKCG
jgi:hypothetical protein